MKTAGKWGCAVAFMVVCALAVHFLWRFTDTDSPILGPVAWERMELETADGRPLGEADPYGDPTALGLKPGERFVLTAHLPEEGEIPGLYQDAYLLMELGAGEAVILLDGAEYFRCDARDQGQALNYQQLHLPLPPDAAGRELTIRYAPLQPDSPFSPLFARFSSDAAAEAASAFYYNFYAVSAGAYALVFVLVCAIFLLGLANGIPDWSLLPLAMAASLTTARQIAVSSGYYVLSPAVYRLLISDLAVAAPTALLLVHLFLNHRRSSLRYLGRVSLLTLAAVAVYYGYSLLTDGRFASVLRYDLVGALSGQPRNLLVLLNTYLLAACGGIAAYRLLQSAVRVYSEAKLLRMKNQLILDNYQLIERNVKNSAALRHDLISQFTALRLLYEKGDLETLGRRLEQLGQEVDRSSLPTFSDHFTVNVLLQNAAAQVEAPEARFVSVSLQVNQGFLAVSCRNGYSGALSLDEKGWPQTTKADPEDHGFGLPQMEAVARKYGSKLDLSYDGGVFTVQTALKLKR